MGTNWTERYDDLLDGLGMDDVVPISGVRILRSFAPDGTPIYQWALDGEENLSQTLGTLYMILHELQHTADAEDEGDPEEPH